MKLSASRTKIPWFFSDCLVQTEKIAPAKAS